MGDPVTIADRAVRRVAAPTKAWTERVISTVAAAPSLEHAQQAIWSHLTDDAAEVLEASAEEFLIAELLGRVGVDVESGHELSALAVLPPKEALAWFRKKKIVSPEEFKNLSGQAKQKAFSVAGLTNQYGLTEAHRTIADSIQSGSSRQQAIKELRDVFERAGLTAKKHHLDLVYRNNVLGSYAAGRYKQMMKVAKRRPFWKYLAVGDDRTRPSHAAMNGRIYPASDPIWGTWYPPNGHNCRCGVTTLSAREIERDGLSVESKPPKEEPDKGWANSPATKQKGTAAAKRKAAGFTEPVLKAPKPAASGSRPYTSAGDIGPADALRKERTINRLAGMKPAEVQSALKGGRFSAETITKLPAGKVQARIPIPSVQMDAAEQLLSQVAADPKTAHLAKAIRLRARAWFDPRTASASRLDAVRLAAGGSGGTDVVIVANAAPADAAALAELALQAQAGASGSVRRAVDVADVVLRGNVGKVKGYRKAWLNRDGTEVRLSRSPLYGYLSEQVQVTRQKWSDLK